MNSLPVFFLAESHEPLFGNQWLALGVILIGVAALMAAVALVGRWLAATHPEVTPKPVVTLAAIVADEPTPETLAVIAACVAVTLGKNARISSVRPVGPSIEVLMQQWSLEGRRQVYSSHQVR